MPTKSALSRVHELDRQRWAVVASFTADGLRIGVRANTRSAFSAVIENLPPVLHRHDVAAVDVMYSVIARDPQGQTGLRTRHLAFVNGARLARSPQFEHIPDAIENHLSIQIAELAKRRVFIHAGVVGWLGRAVLIPGRSLAGKSTLVAALLRAGASYYSDEFAVVDRLGYVHPYPRPLQLRNGDGSLQSIRLANVLAQVGGKPLRVGLVLVARYRKGATWRPRKLSPGEGLLAVLTNTVSAQRQPDRALRVLTAMLRGAVVLGGRRDEADALVAWLKRTGHLAA